MSGDLTGHCLYMADFVVLRRPVTNLVTALNNLDKLTNGLFITEFFAINESLSFRSRTYLLRAAKTALTAQTGSLVSPTKNVTSHSSGIEAKNLMSSDNPSMFSKMLKSSCNKVHMVKSNMAHS